MKWNSGCLSLSAFTGVVVAAAVAAVIVNISILSNTILYCIFSGFKECRGTKATSRRAEIK